MKSKEIPFLRRKLGIVFQDFQLLPDRSINDNLLYVMKATEWKDKVQMQKRTQEVLEKVHLGTKGFKMPHELSGGEQQRVVIARSLVHRPKLLVADEPTGNLDSINAQEIVTLLKKINEFGTTIVLVTHNREIVNMLKKRVITIDHGHIIANQKAGKYLL